MATAVAQAAVVMHGRTLAPAATLTSAAVRGTRGAAPAVTHCTRRTRTRGADRWSMCVI